MIDIRCPWFFDIAKAQLKLEISVRCPADALARFIPSMRAIYQS